MASQAAIKQKAAEHAAKGEYNLAIEEYNKLLAENDNDAAVHNLVADTYLKMGDKDQAIVEFERAVEIYREDAFYTNAIAVCKKILRTDRERSSVYQDMADLYANEGLLGEAVANYKEFADRMKARGDMEKVFVTYQKIKEIMPKKVDIRLALVDMYLARNRNEDAVSELREVGKLFREQDKIEDAEGVESRIIALGGSLGLERVAGAPKEEKKQADVDFYTQFENVPPGLRETGAETGAATAETVTAEPQAPPGETVEVAPDTEIKFEQTMSDLEAEKTEAPAETVPEAAVSESVEAGVDVVRVEEEISAPAEETAEPEEVKAEAAPALTEEELVAESSKADYEPIFKSSPTDWASYVELGDLCLSVGSTDEALGYFYQAGDAYFNEKSFERATEIYRKIAEIKPMELRPRQRLVQIAQKKGDAQVMVEAYTGLADCLERRGAAKEASTVYKKLLDIDPENEAARAKLSAEAGQPARAFAEEVPEPQPAEAGPEGKDRPQVEPGAVGAAAGATVSFDDIVKEVGSGKSRKFKIEDEPGHREGLLTMGELLQEFKSGVEENIPAGDYASHYDLGITYKEMGLLDEAVDEFTKSSKGPEMAAKAFEMLGRIFLDKGEYEKAIEQLQAGLSSKVAVPEEQIGLYYHSGKAYEAIGDKKKAFAAYSKVKQFDPSFQDVDARLAAVKVEAEPAPPAKEEVKPAKERAAKKKGKISYV